MLAASFSPRMIAFASACSGSDVTTHAVAASFTRPCECLQNSSCASIILPYTIANINLQHDQGRSNPTLMCGIVWVLGAFRQALSMHGITIFSVILITSVENEIPSNRGGRRVATRQTRPRVSGFGFELIWFGS